MILLSRKIKILIISSISLNIILFSIVIWSIIQMNYITERTLKVNVIDKLFELQEIIAKQENEEWGNLDFLSNVLQDTGLSVAHAANVGVTSKTINNDDAEALIEFGGYLNGFSISINNQNVSKEAKEKMKSELLEFNSIIAEEGFDHYEAFDNWTTKNYLTKIKAILSKLE